MCLSLTFQSISTEIDNILKKIGAGDGDLGGLQSAVENVTMYEQSYNNTALELQSQVKKLLWFFSRDIVLFLRLVGILAILGIFFVYKIPG